MAIRVGINGFGRIGRLVFHALPFTTHTESL
ncbi:MAG TPA: glyceraldehyde 3-phosphate dehydrogenase N-terminal domain-containing protein, partial [Thermoanaerobaculia bacterium]|nr:glyceraldehyde 3-phosphate dehydrogenase N-terminal domain-containing protein [Thermoanaerobaculia bacterium]